MSAWRTPVTLGGRHVVLRPLERSDAAALAAAAADQLDLFYANVALMRDPEAVVDGVLSDQAAGRALPFAVTLPTGEVVGTTRLMRMNEAHRRLEMGGTFYATRVQRTGVNTEAKRLLFGHAFDTLGCVSVQLRTDHLNRRSQAAIERLGARRDGVLRGHQIVDGRRRDTIVYSVQDHEWPGVAMNLDRLLARGGASA
ncbi:RimJ/RimL family protein N-acetyltransferase [Sphingomonas jejuensis]|uniref:RimJ/RimL family protein N-acetyltransferase n=1 Tax=Sphingomonas jejuensis TaxID=904715 RepID=A0ABX0XIP9_9SPHN|nr:GNAT family protein [Sphingomonas jejuensis]NJC33206.1 RimJ/RimL family protein N-acetyltransferase [Sphingomonas jejuensis]